MLITLSADHGCMNIPEYGASRRLHAGRIDPDKMIEDVNAALSAKFGEGRYVKGVVEPDSENGRARWSCAQPFQ